MGFLSSLSRTLGALQRIENRKRKQERDRLREEKRRIDLMERQIRLEQREREQEAAFIRKSLQSVLCFMTSYRKINEAVKAPAKQKLIEKAMKQVRELVRLQTEGTLNCDILFSELESDLRDLQRFIEQCILDHNDLMNDEGKKTPICPSCSETLEELPARSKKCPTCSRQILRVKDNADEVYLINQDTDARLREILKQIRDKKLVRYSMEAIQGFEESLQSEIDKY